MYKINYWCSGFIFSMGLYLFIHGNIALGALYTAVSIANLLAAITGERRKR